MFHTIITYEADGTQRDFAVPFAFIKKEYVKAYTSDPVMEGTLVGELRPAGFIWLNSGMIRLNDVVPAGQTITIQRETYADNPLVDFQDAAIVTEADLDLAVLQMLHVAQEARDRNSHELLEATQSLLETAQTYVDAADRLEETLGGYRTILQNIQDALAIIADTSYGDIGSPVATEYFISDGIATSYTISRPKIGKNILLLAFDTATRSKLYFAEEAAVDGSVGLKLADPLPAGTSFGVTYLRSVNTDGDASLLEELAEMIETKADIGALDAYALTEDVNARLATKANAATLVNYALKEELVDGLEWKADITELDDYVTKEGSEQALALKADAASLDVYALAEDVNVLLATKADAASLASYALNTDLSSGLEAKADVIDLADYLTNADATAALALKADAASLEDYVLEADMAAELAYKADLVGGFIKAEQLPPGAIPVNHTVVNEADLTGLTGAIPNDKAKVTSTGEIWLLWKAPPTAAANWENLTDVGDPIDIGVSSVAGKTGAVTLTPGDISGLPAALDDKANASDLANYATNAALTSGLAGKAGTAVATVSANGLMAASDKGKLNGIAAGAQVNTVTSVAGRTGAVTVTAADVGLGNVNNTSDANKPISTAAQAALNLKAPITSVPKMYSGTIAGNGSTVAFTVTHNLGTNKLHVQTFDSSGNEVVFGKQIVSAAAVKLTAATAPANGSTFTVIVMGIPS